MTRELTVDSFRRFYHQDVQVQRYIKTTIEIVVRTPVIKCFISVFDGLTSCMMSQISGIIPLLPLVE